MAAGSDCWKQRKNSGHYDWLDLVRWCVAHSGSACWVDTRANPRRLARLHTKWLWGPVDLQTQWNKVVINWSKMWVLITVYFSIKNEIQLDPLMILFVLFFALVKFEIVLPWGSRTNPLSSQLQRHQRRLPARIHTWTYTHAQHTWTGPQEAQDIGNTDVIQSRWQGNRKPLFLQKQPLRLAIFLIGLLLSAIL